MYLIKKKKKTESFLGSLETCWRVCGIVFGEDFQKSIILYEDEWEVFTEEVLEKNGNASKTRDQHQECLCKGDKPLLTMVWNLMLYLTLVLGEEVMMYTVMHTLKKGVGD